ncbi:MAG: zinc ABC transporter substrate-binding protein [Planctomycetia bacterium]|nr:zinc ABC transporter substrate-binding protein [Planctomycetia bacterium]
MRFPRYKNAARCNPALGAEAAAKTAASFSNSLSRRDVLAAGAGALVSVLVGCGSQAESHHGSAGSSPLQKFAGKHPIRAVCTTGMVADIVRRVGGGWVDVTQLMGEGIDPHLFKATPGVISSLAGADAIFYSGLHLEGRMTDVFENMANRRPVTAITSTIPVDKLIPLGGDSYDPHVWFDVGLWSSTIESVRKFLGEFDPAHVADYDAQAAAYRTELAALDLQCRKQLEAIPKEFRVLITAHDAFHYFGRAYDVEVKAIQGVSTDTEAGLREINALVDFIVARKIKAVFIEASVSDRNVRNLLEGCQSQGHEVRIGGELFSDSMGKPGTPEGTYAGMVHHNVAVIVGALK